MQGARMGGFTFYHILWGIFNAMNAKRAKNQALGVYYLSVLRLKMRLASLEGFTAFNS
jgi:hypothetical protein